VAERSARRTIRLKEGLERLALAPGGEPGSRLSTVLRLRCSPDTLLRWLGRLPNEPFEPPRVVSLEDWAWRRGHRYGTLIGDLERHRRLAVLPDRAVAQVAAWLKRCPSIDIWHEPYSSLFNQENELGGFFTFKQDGQRVEIGLGLRPDLPGKGLGLAFVIAGLAFGQEHFAVGVWSLSVAPFTTRAPRLDEHAGFTSLTTFLQHTHGRAYECLRMGRPACELSGNVHCLYHSKRG
jgi:RimJ/RimL family protein N-acetyltransferase